MVYELCGIPGCGKSTFSAALFACKDSPRILAKNELVDNKFMKQYKKVHRKYGNFLDTLVNQAELRALLIDFAKAYTCSQNDSVNKMIYEKTLELSLALRMKGNRKIVLDEGFVQFISSIPYDNEVEADDNFFKMMSYLIDVKNYRVIDCEIDFEVAANRIISRNREGDRYLSADIDDIVRLLEVKKRNINYIIELLFPRQNIIKLNMMDGLDENIDKIKAWLEI